MLPSHCRNLYSQQKYITNQWLSYYSSMFKTRNMLISHLLIIKCLTLKFSKVKYCSYLDKQLVFYFHSSLHILLRILNGETKKKTRINKNANLLIIIIATFMKLIRQDAISSHFCIIFLNHVGSVKAQETHCALFGILFSHEGKQGEFIR